MNPFDAVGTARVSQAISDRMCRISIPYQDAPGERAIVERVTARPSPLTEPAVELTRLTREHAQVRMGSSVRGAIDLVRLGRELAALRGEGEPAPGDATFADAAIAALSGRLRLDESAERTAEEIILELIERLVPKPEPEDAPKGKAGGLRRAAARGRSLSGAAARDVVKERGRRTLRRDQLAGAHPQLEQVSPAVGRLDEDAFHDLLRTDRRRRDRAARRPRRRHRPAAARPGPPARRRGCSCAAGGSARARAAATAA